MNKTELNPLEESKLGHVTGGVNGTGTAQVGDKVFVNGPLYMSSSGEVCCGNLKGVFCIQRYAPGRSKPYLLKSNVGWVGAESVTFPI